MSKTLPDKNWRLKVLSECWLKLLGPVDDGQLEYYKCMCENHIHRFSGLASKPDPKDDPCERLRLYLSSSMTESPWLVTDVPPLQLSTHTQVYTMPTPSNEYTRNYVITAGLFGAVAILWCLVMVLLGTVRRTVRAGANRRTRETDSSPGMSPRASVQIACADPPPYEVVADQPPPYWSIQSPPPYTDHAAAAKTPDDDVVT